MQCDVRSAQQPRFLAVVLSCFLTATISLLTIYLLRPERIAKRVNNDVPKSCHHGKKCILIHHIHAGVNVVTVMIFPDGTTMLVDCGNLDVPKFNKKYEKQTATSPKLGVVSITLPTHPKQQDNGCLIIYIIFGHIWIRRYQMMQSRTTSHLILEK